jgi:hypothetical protein
MHNVTNVVDVEHMRKEPHLGSDKHLSKPVRMSSFARPQKDMYFLVVRCDCVNAERVIVPTSIAVFGDRCFEELWLTEVTPDAVLDHRHFGWS